MLVLSRKLNEKIVIDGGIVVTVVKIDRNQIRLGIEAPGNVRVFREEIVGNARRGADQPVARECLSSLEHERRPVPLVLRKVEEKIDIRLTFCSTTDARPISLVSSRFW